MNQTDHTPDARRPLRREIAGLLVVKLVALTALYLAFFGPSTRPHIATPDLAAHLTGGNTPLH